MKRQAIFVLALVFGISSFTFAQMKTVTNSDLEQFRQKRLQAERDLEENYEQMGFDSPEEIERQNEESQRQLRDLSDNLRETRLTRESQNSQNNYGTNEGQYFNGNSNQYPNPAFIDYGRYYGSGGYYGGGFGNSNFTNFNNRRGGRYGNGGYYNRGFRQRFIDGLPDFVRRNHRFNPNIPNTNTRRGFKPVRRSGTRIGIRIRN